MSLQIMTKHDDSQANSAVSQKSLADAIRVLSMDAVEKAGCGHPGLPMGLADVATVLFTRFAKFNPADPVWPDRDRVVLSAGHGSMLLYSALYLLGYSDITIEEIKNFRQMGARTAGHPEYGVAGGIETTTGPLGQGLGNAVGMAMAEKHLAAEFGADVMDHFTYVLASDGDLMEGISQESIALAGHLKLSKLIVLWDDNEISIDGPVSLSDSTDQLARFKASGWSAERVDGHDPEAIAAAIARAQETDSPSLIACRTTIGYGAPTKAGKSSSHGAALGADEITGARKAYGWDHAPFEVPQDILSAWRDAGSRNTGAYDEWSGRFAALDAAKRNDLERRFSRELPEKFDAAVDSIKKAFTDAGKPMATRKASGEVLSTLMKTLPELLGGSADLTGSVNTRADGGEAMSADNPAGRFIHYGIREHGMAAAMNGMALHGGIIPFSGTFLVFSDYCRPSVRLSALMQQQVIYVFTHDSIGVGEDGPTHQPVEHLAALRAIPHLNVFRPCDPVETAECWAVALEQNKAPSTLVLTRQNLETVRTEHTKENLSARGAYVLRPATAGSHQVTLIATGSEVGVALKARDALESRGIGVSVVSMPCWELFDAQESDYKEAVMGKAPVRVAVEAAISMGWERYLGSNGAFIGMTGFGRSAPAGELYDHFGITAEGVVNVALDKLKNTGSGRTASGEPGVSA